MRLTYRDSTVPHTNAKGELWEAYSDRNYNEVINKLAAYEDAEEQGLLVRLPCKVGDTVFTAFGGEGVFCGKVYAISTCDGTNWFSVRYDRTLRYDHTWDKIGKTVFFFREEAEAALKGEMEGV